MKEDFRVDPYGNPPASGSAQPPQPPQPALEPVHGGAPDPRWLAPQGTGAGPQGHGAPPQGQPEGWSPAPPPGYAPGVQPPGYQPAYPPAYQPAYPPAAAYAPPPAPAKPKGSRLVNGLLVVAAVVAIGGLAFAVGRMTAPATATTGTTGQNLGLGTDRFPTASGVPGGFGFRGTGGGAVTLQGTVSAISADSITLTTTAGTSVVVPTDTTTTYHAQADATRSGVAVGTTVKVELAGFGGRQGGGLTPGASVPPGGLPGTGSGRGFPQASGAPGGFGGAASLGAARDVEVVGSPAPAR